MISIGRNFTFVLKRAASFCILVLFTLFESFCSSRGKCLMGDCENGKGTLFLEEQGLLCNGSFRNQKLNGRGTCHDQKAQYLFSGIWHDGALVEDARISFPDKRIYSGEVKDLKPEGNGDMRYPDGKFYIGYFERGLRNGKGVLRNENDEIIFSGEWRNDKPVNKR